jgi:hypothetical protein
MRTQQPGEFEQALAKPVDHFIHQAAISRLFSVSSVISVT